MRDFCSLSPEIKGYTRDLVPNIQIDPHERVAVMRKGGTITVRDYLPNHQLPNWLTFGLAWDVTNGVNIDLDASIRSADKSEGDCKSSSVGLTKSNSPKLSCNSHVG